MTRTRFFKYTTPASTVGMRFLLVSFWCAMITTTAASSSSSSVSPRVLMRERFPSGIKIDRFSTSWPSSASVMADMLEGATAREMLEQQRLATGSDAAKISKQQYQARLQEANRLVNAGKASSGGKSFRRVTPPFQGKSSLLEDDKQAAAWTTGIIALLAAGLGVGLLANTSSDEATAITQRRNAPILPIQPPKVFAPRALPPPKGTATIPEHTFNLVKAIVGVGVLSLPSGIAAFGNARSAVIPAVGLIVLMGILSAVGFSWIGQVCHYTGARSYTEAWAKTVGPKTSSLPAWSTTTKTFLACLAFSMVLADSLTALVPLDSRTTVLWTVTSVILLPLCWLKNLKSLAPFSLLGVMGMVYTALAMTYRFARGSYLGGSPLLADLSERLMPSFGEKGFKAVASPQSVILVSMLSTAYMAHFSAPKYQVELKDNTIPRFNTVVALGFGISILLTAWISAVGFSTFGGNCQGLVLNNYSTNDLAMSISRSAVAISLIFSYPLAFQACRDGFLDLMGMKNRSNARLNMMTVTLLLVLTGLATILKDVSFVLAFGGATLGNLLCYVYPALMYVKVRPDMTVPAVALAVSGLVLGSIGAKLALDKL